MDSKKICLIYQPCGLGDILFLQKFAHIQKEKGYEIYWPVVHEFEWLNDYIPEFNFISWGDTEKKLTGPPLPDHIKFPYKEYYNPNSNHIFTDNFIFFNGFHRIPPNKLIMAYKYETIGMNYKDWSNYINFNRNHKKENELFILKGLKKQEPYVFINKKYCMRPYVMNYPHISSDPLVYGKRVVELDIISNYTLLDWCKIIEEADEIHMIETSLNYVMETEAIRPNLKSTKFVLYSRHNNFGQVQYLFNIPWNYRHL